MNEQELIIAIVIFLLLLKYQRSSTQQMIAEHFTNDEVRSAIKDVYDADVAAIKNLSDIAARLLTDKKLTVPGALDIKDDVKLTKSLEVGTDAIVKGGIQIGGAVNLASDLNIVGSASIPTIKGNVNAANDVAIAGTMNCSKVLEGGNALIPKGVIVAWSGAQAPAGWALCDGQNSTPDLRGRFIRMFNDTKGGNEKELWKYNEESLVTAKDQETIIGASRTITKSWIMKHRLGDKGGTDTHVLTVEEMPSHIHGMSGGGNGGGWGGMIAISDGNDFDHNRNTKSAGSSWGHNNVPPYYALAYIMKL